MLEKGILWEYLFILKRSPLLFYLISERGDLYEENE